MSTPWKDLEDAFWDFLDADLAAETAYTALKQYRSHEGRGLPFAGGAVPFQDPTLLPAMWLQLSGIDADISTPRVTLSTFAFRGGIAYAVPSDATNRDPFEAVVELVRGAILRRMTPDVQGVSVHALTNETVVAVLPAGMYAPVIGYVYEFRLVLGFEVYAG